MMRAVDQEAIERAMDQRSIGEAMHGASGESESYRKSDG
jgi:hypothetical protein